MSPGKVVGVGCIISNSPICWGSLWGLSLCRSRGWVFHLICTCDRFWVWVLLPAPHQTIKMEGQAHLVWQMLSKWKSSYLFRFQFSLGFWILNTTYFLIRTSIHLCRSVEHFYILICIFSCFQYRGEYRGSQPEWLVSCTVGNGLLFLIKKVYNFDVVKWSCLFLYDYSFLVLSKRSFLTLSLPVSQTQKYILLCSVYINVRKGLFLLLSIWKTRDHGVDMTFDLFLYALVS